MSNDHDDRKKMQKLDQKLQDLLTQAELEPVPDAIRDLAIQLKSALDDHEKGSDKAVSISVEKLGP